MTTIEDTLYYGDNLDVLRRYVGDESVDLVYLDPPFNSSIELSRCDDIIIGRGELAAKRDALQS